jgi:chromosome segregation ATPase
MQLSLEKLGKENISLQSQLTGATEHFCEGKKVADSRLQLEQSLSTLQQQLEQSFSTLQQEQMDLQMELSTVKDERTDLETGNKKLESLYNELEYRGFEKKLIIVGKNAIITDLRGRELELEEENNRLIKANKSGNSLCAVSGSTGT